MSVRRLLGSGRVHLRRDPAPRRADCSRRHAMSKRRASTRGVRKTATLRKRTTRAHRPARPKGVEGTTPLKGRVAVVAGATRGAGRGIARALSEAGATVYCTGRSVRGNPSPYRRPETIDETAELITAAGGAAIAVRVDHTIEEEVEALVQRIDRERGRLDVLVDCVAGEEPMMHQWGSFWKTNLEHGEAVFRQCILSHILTAKHVAPVMIRARRGL